MTAEAAVPSQAAATGFRDLLRGDRRRLTIGLLFITLTVATESMVVTAIMPAIVRDLGGVSLYGVAFSAFFLAGLAAIPIAGWAADHFGPAPPFLVLLGIFLAGSVVAALAPSMPVLILGRALQGYGGSAQFTVSLAAVTRVYEGRARVLMLSLSSTTWTLPALLGPGAGALIAATWGWRWAFGLVVLPGLLAFALTAPQLARLGRAQGAPAAIRVPMRLPIQVAAGTGLAVAGLTTFNWLSPALVVAGLAIAAPALRRILPEGTARLRAGLPAVVAAAFCLNVAFYATTSFIPLALTGLRGLSIAQAGIAVTVGTVSWSASVLVNTRLVDRFHGDRLVVVASGLLVAGIAGAAAVAGSAPVWLIYAASMALGGGMGAAFNVFTLNTMALAPAGREGGAVAARNLSASLGTAIGTGVGGAMVAASLALRAGLRPGILGVFALSGVAGLATMALARRASPRSPAGAAS